MVIRLASSDDSESLSALVLKASRCVKEKDFTNEGWNFLKSTNTPEAFQKRFEASNYLCWVCEIDEEISGYLAMIDNQKIDHMFVLADHRRKGICRCGQELQIIAKNRVMEITSGFAHHHMLSRSIHHLVFALQARENLQMVFPFNLWSMVKMRVNKAKHYHFARAHFTRPCLEH